MFSLFQWLTVKTSSLSLPHAHKSPYIWKWRNLKDQAHIQEGLTQKMAHMNTFFYVTMNTCSSILMQYGLQNELHIHNINTEFPMCRWLCKLFSTLPPSNASGLHHSNGKGQLCLWPSVGLSLFWKLIQGAVTEPCTGMEKRSENYLSIKMSVLKSLKQTSPQRKLFVSLFCEKEKINSWVSKEETACAKGQQLYHHVWIVKVYPTGETTVNLE